jgi:hypothetical protein
MAETPETAAETSAEKAYAAAAEALTAKSASEPDLAPEVEFPSKAKRARKAKVEAPVVAAPAPKTVVTEPMKAAPAALKPTTVRRAAAKKIAAKNTSKKITLPKTAKPKTAKPKAVKPKALPKAKTPKAVALKTTAPKSLFQQLKDKTMDTADITTKIKSAVSEAQGKAKEAFDKGAATFAEYNEFSKGNVEAVVASGKILTTGMQALGKTLVEDSKIAFGTLTAEAKELAAVKSPTDFFKLQAALLRRNFDLVVSNTSKNSEAVLKLAGEAAAPISARVNLAVEKIKQAA